MRCIVTAGPTFEPLDRVRRLTNLSTGRLGSELAAFLGQRQYEVTLLLGQHATWRSQSPSCATETFTTTADLRERLARLAATPGCGAVFHAAAVSDFAFGKIWRRSAAGELIEITSGKLSTRQGNLFAELVPTPKLISELRGWFPQALLVGWKYEVEGDRQHVLSAARAQLTDCRTDASVANGPAYGTGFGVVRTNGECQHCQEPMDLFTALEKLLKNSNPGLPRL